MNGVAIVILGGGEARRFPRKLERPLRGTPLLLAVYQHVAGRNPVYVSVNASFSRSLADALPCPLIIDELPERGPLGGLATAAATIGEELIFAVAGDAPGVTLEVLDALLAAWQPGDRCAVPEHEGRAEPLAGLYLRKALLREATQALAEGRYSMHGIIERLGARHIPMPPRYFSNVNTEADLERIGEPESKGLA